MAKARVVLVNMPFGTTHYPSIQAGLLKAIAHNGGIPVDCRYINLEFARRIGSQAYNFLSNYRGPLLGEWMFSEAAFGDSVPAPGAFIDKYRSILDTALDRTKLGIEDLIRIRSEEVPKFLDECADRIIEKAYDVACFTSTFEQNVASFALARRLKSLRPAIWTVFGGANFDGGMGRAYVAAVPWIDVAVSGEADSVFVPLLNTILNGHEPKAFDGVIWQNGQSPQGQGRATYSGSMNELPVPDYTEYFETLQNLDFKEEELGAPVSLLTEGSRGCWWGEKHHCKFCGLNGLGMGFRSKTTDRLVEDIQVLSSRHRISRINAVDNIIGRSQMRGLADYMKSSDLDYELFFEIKANLTRQEIMKLADGSINHVQPGIESFSSSVLKLMDKGISGIQNVNSLRWFAYYGVHAFWNIIYGFPGERDDDYNSQADLIKKLHFIPPPRGVGPIWLERFSPYFRDAIEGRNFRNVRPHESYGYVYPADLDAAEAAYFFESDVAEPVAATSVQSLLSAISAWRQRWDVEPLPTLGYQKMTNGVRVIDGRAGDGQNVSYFYTDILADIFLACVDRPVSVENIRSLLGPSRMSCYSTEDIESALARLISRNLVIHEANLFLALPLPLRRGRQGPALPVAMAEGHSERDRLRVKLEF